MRGMYILKIYEVNSKTLVKEIQEQNKWKFIPCPSVIL